MNQESGKYVRLRFSSADASTAAAITIWDENGAQVALGATQRLYISDLLISLGAAALTVTLFDDVANAGTADAGEELAWGEFIANGGLAMSYLEPVRCKKGNLPKVKTSGAGNIKLSGSGFIKDA